MKWITQFTLYMKFYEYMNKTRALLQIMCCYQLQNIFHILKQSSAIIMIK